MRVPSLMRKTVLSNVYEGQMMNKKRIRTYRSIPALKSLHIMINKNIVSFVAVLQKMKCFIVAVFEC